jgi:hypothetical protein
VFAACPGRPPALRRLMGQRGEAFRLEDRKGDAVPNCSALAMQASRFRISTATCSPCQPAWIEILTAAAIDRWE